MDVINFSGGGPTIDPANDPMYEVVANVAAAGVVPVMSAGNDRDDFGLGSAGSPASPPRNLGRRRLERARLRNDDQRHGARRAGSSRAFRSRPRPAGSRRPGRRKTRRSSTWARSWAQPPARRAAAVRVGARPERPVDQPAAAALPPRAIALASRGTCTFVSKAERARAAGAIGLVLVNNRARRRDPRRPRPAGRHAGGRRRRPPARRHGGHVGPHADSGRGEHRDDRDGAQRRRGELFLGRPDRVRARGPSRTSPPGGSSILLHAAGVRRLAVRRLRRAPAWPHRTSPGAAAPRCSVTASGRRAKESESALVSSAGSAWGNTLRTHGGPVLLQGGGLANVRRRTTRSSSPTRSRSPSADSTCGGAPCARARDSHRRRRRQPVERRGPGRSPPRRAPPSTSQDDLAGAGRDGRASGGGRRRPPPRTWRRATASTTASSCFIGAALTRQIPYLFLVTRPWLPYPGRRRGGCDDCRPAPRGWASLGSIVTTSRPPRSARRPARGTADGRDGMAGPCVRGEQRGRQRRRGGRRSRIPSPALIHPGSLGSLDENDVQGCATPVNANGLTPDYLGEASARRAPCSSAEDVHHVSVDSGREPLHGRARHGRYVLARVGLRT